MWLNDKDEDEGSIYLAEVAWNPFPQKKFGLNVESGEGGYEQLIAHIIEVSGESRPDPH